MTILLVEDDRGDSEPLREYFEMAGHDVMVTEYAGKAVQIIQKENIDAVITDMQLRGTDQIEGTHLDGGVKVIEAVVQWNIQVHTFMKGSKSLKPDEQKPTAVNAVLVYSGYLEKNGPRVKKLRELIPDITILNKPQDPDILLSKINELIEKSNKQQGK